MMNDQSGPMMERPRYLGYLTWISQMWELREAENLMFVYTVLRRL